MFEFFPTRQQVIVHLKNSKSIRGFIMKHTSRYIELKNAELLQSSDSIIPLDGGLILYVPDIDFVQTFK